MTKNEMVLFQVLEDFGKGKISRSDAAKLLGCSQRAVTRRAAKIRRQGIEGIKHGNYQSPAHNKLSDELKNKVLKLAKDRYYDFNLTHCLEKIEEIDKLKLSYTTFHRWCRSAGLGKRKKRRPSKVRIARERMSNQGFLLQMDGSHHAWNGKDKWCLIAMIDDATSEIPFAKFFNTETTRGCMEVLRGVIEAKGIPSMIYTDNAGWAGGGKRENFTQFLRACEQLGIRVLTTSSPQAKGRIERSWGTTQDRLIPELRLAGITTMKDSNRYLEQVYLPKYWDKHLTVEARDEETRYRELTAEINLDKILTYQHKRQVNNGHQVHFKALSYRILDQRYGNLKRKEVTLYESELGEISMDYAGQPLIFEPIKPVRNKWLKEAS